MFGNDGQFFLDFASNQFDGTKKGLQGNRTPQPGK